MSKTESLLNGEPWKDSSIRRSAYKKPEASQMTPEELVAVLITTDGRGALLKIKALRELLRSIEG